MRAVWDASTRLGASKAWTFREDSAPLLTPGLIAPLFASEHRIPGTGWRPGQRRIAGLSEGQDRAEPDIIVPVLRVVVVAVR